MTVQQFPQYPQQPYAQQPMAPAYPQVPQQPVYQAPPQQYGGQFPQAPAIPAQPLANGTLDDYYSQPSGGGPAISWKGKPDGTTYIGVVARDVTNGDVQHDTDPQTKQPKYYRDGRPMFAMRIPLLVQTPEFPGGEVSLYVRGALRDELSRAMSEAGVEGAPKQGDVLQVTLVGRKAGQGAIPKNVYAVVYQRQGASPAPQQPVQQQPAAQPVQQYAPAPQVQQPVVDQQVVAPVHPVQQQAQPVQQVAQPVQAPQQPLQAAPGISDEQAQLLARLTGQAPA